MQDFDPLSSPNFKNYKWQLTPNFSNIANKAYGITSKTKSTKNIVLGLTGSKLKQKILPRISSAAARNKFSLYLFTFVRKR